jgi:hypothetical protein
MNAGALVNTPFPQLRGIEPILSGPRQYEFVQKA